MSATIAARAHSSATLTAPIKRPLKSRRPATPLARIGRLVGARPGRAVLLLLFSAVAVAILVNAMLFQKVRHPAPIISAPVSSAPQRQAERRQETPFVAPAPAATSPTAAPLPPSRPSDLAHGAREAAAPRPPAAVSSVPRAAPVAAAPAPARSAAARDPIADLINGADFRPPAEIRGGAARPAPARRAVEN
jgi:hypothetical protein